jgi:nucleotide-binding universal stress UspA family protein
MATATARPDAPAATTVWIHADPAMSAPRGVRRVVVATDASAAAGGAMRAASLVARRCDAMVDVVAVLEPIDYVVEFERTGRTARSMLATLGARVRDQLLEVAPDVERSGWGVALDVGPADQTICRAALLRAADLLVVGLGRHGAAVRAGGSQTALRVARLAPMPLLAVPESFAALPRTIVVATDFGPGSVGAARAALAIAPRDAELHLVHCRQDWSADPRLALHFARFRRALEAPRSVTCRPVVLAADDPACALLSYARAQGAELIAAGSTTDPDAPGRAVLGRVPTQLLHSSEHAVLLGGWGRVERNGTGNAGC